jgi:hypothetical protein
LAIGGTERFFAAALLDGPVGFDDAFGDVPFLLVDFATITLLRLPTSVLQNQRTVIV